ncbi:MAG: DUF192 domain-containing protein [Ignavibacteriota bacterium]
MRVVVRNRTRGTVLGDAVELADTSAKRRTGLLKHTHLDPGTGLWIVPCESVHTFFMKFAIDLVYIDRKQVVRKVRHAGTGVAAVGLPHGALHPRTTSRYGTGNRHGSWRSTGNREIRLAQASYLNQT